MRWTAWLRTIVGLRGDLYTRRGRQRPPVNSGECQRPSIASPKFGLVLRAVGQDRVLPQRRPRLPQQRRARHDHHRSIPATRSRRRRDAAAGALQGRRGRHAHAADPRARQLGRAVRARLRLRAPVRRRCRHHRGQPPEPPRRRRMDQPLQARCRGSASTSTSPTPARASPSTIRGAATASPARRRRRHVGRHRLRPARPAGSASAKLRYFGPRPLIEDNSVRSNRHDARERARRLQVRATALRVAARRLQPLQRQERTRSTTSMRRACRARWRKASPTGISIRSSRSRCG